MFGCANAKDETARKALKILKIILSIMAKNFFCNNHLKHNLVLTEDLYLSLENNASIFLRLRFDLLD